VNAMHEVIRQLLAAYRRYRGRRVLKIIARQIERSTR